MSMLSEIAIEQTIKAITTELLKIRDGSVPGGLEWETTTKAIMLCLGHFEWDTPKWAKELHARLTRELREAGGI